MDNGLREELGLARELAAVSEDHRAFVASLPPEELQLIIIRNELYDGSWEDMKKDLEHRRDGKPFVFKLINRIEEDLVRIERLRAYETRAKVDLGDYLDDE